MAVTTLNGPRNFVGRQYSLDVLVDFGAGTNDVADGVHINLPPNTLVVDGTVTVATVFGGTTPVLTAVDNAVTPLSYFGNVSASAAATTAAVTAVKGTFYPFGALITIGVAGTAVTAGLAIVRISYVQLNRENEVYSVGS